MKKILISIVIVVFSMNTMAISKQVLKGAGVSEQQLIEVFNIAVFGLEKDRKLSRWEKDIPLVIWLTGEGSQQHLDVFSSQMDEIGKLTGVEARSKKRGEGQFNVLFNVTSTPYFDALVTHRETIERFYKNERVFLLNCLKNEKSDARSNGITMSKSSTNQKVAGSFAIPSDIGNYKSGIGALLMYLFGFSYSSELAHPISDSIHTSMNDKVIFSEGAYDGKLTNLDKLLLKILYDERLNSGMTYHQAQPFIKKIIDDL